MKPLFSIITICYNAGKTIEQTLRSVAAQSYDAIEYIIIDGASKDNTLNVIAPFKSRIACLVSEPDNGIYDAMNKGLEKASGDYVWFMNAGDTFYSATTLQEVVSGLKGEKLPDILYGETAIMDSSGKIVGSRRLKAPEVLTWKSFRQGMLVCHQSFVVLRSIAEPYDLRYRYSADVDWCIRCMKKADSIQNTQMILSSYLDEGATTANRKASLKERFKIMCHYYGTTTIVLLHLWFAVRFFWAKLVHGRV
ncbi:MAG: glycosyltransferase family 2 protein [Bacteroidales bacterium]|nr:glycosyltransferase family 2 protein [Bacteroidales bacterium]